MQHLIKLSRLTTKTCASITLLLLLSQAVFASEIKIFLNKEHADQVTGIAEAKAYGFTVNYIYVDRIDEVQDQISQRVTEKYQPAIDAVVANIGLEALMAMGDIERTEFFMQEFAKMKVKPVTPSTILPSELDDVKYAISDVNQAEEQGITPEMLPAVILNGQLYQQQYDLLTLIKENQK
ncbi:hypothetical protein [uncultured Cocleimonas sp.]|uniref:hypothetical protein n=1 Tax=uncultured Cocleimonas sp. TaxID=1051587 RepID=UPI00261E6593|nr:hypothetical protein [uncultured Cocleimonas sp.]